MKSGGYKIHIFTLIATVFPLKSAFCDEKNGISNDFLPPQK